MQDFDHYTIMYFANTMDVVYHQATPVSQLALFLNSEKWSFNIFLRDT